jgi:hypothetical protein
MSLVLNVEILGEFKKLTSATQGAQNSLSKLGDKATKLGRGITRALGAVGISLGFAAIVQGAKESIDAASDLEQQFGALDSIFKKNSSQMKTFSKEMNQIGLSTAEAARQSSYLGAMLKGSGLSIDDTTDKTKDLVRLAGDLAATFGGPTSQAVSAIASLMRGERDPIERYGVSLKQVDINAQMLTDAKNGLVFASEKEAAMNATLTLLYEKTTDAQGQAARESDTYAGKMGELAARFKDLQATIGVILLPALIKVGEWFVKVIPDIQRFFKQMMDAFSNPRVQDAFRSLDTSLGNLGKSFASLFRITAGSEAQGFVLFFEVMARLLAGIVQTVDIMVQGFKNAFPIFNTFSNLVNGIANAMVAISGAKLPSIAPPSTSAPNTGGGKKGSAGSQNVTININKGNVTAKEIAKAVNKGTKTGGAPILTGIALRKALR